MNNPDVFGTLDVKQVFASNYIPLISFHSQEQKNKAESYILEQADDFFVNIIEITIPIQCIPYYKTISWQDFSKIEIDYFYQTLFFDLGKRDSSGKLINNLKWSVTFDAEIAPIQTAYLLPGDKEAKLIYSDNRRPCLRYHPQNHFPLYRRYGVITLNGEAVFYYLYFTLQEILDAIK